MALAPQGAKYVTILSIDGGGVRGIIPAKILEFLESKLQELDGEGVRLADYFDVVAGTSTGGLIATMLTAPDGNNPPRPMFTSKDILNFYLLQCPKVFHGSDLHKYPVAVKRLYNAIKMVKYLFGPKYNGKYLKLVLKKHLGELRLSQTLTNLVIPAFDIKYLQPVIFTTADAKEKCDKNARLVDVCVSTSAAPTLLPAHYFETKDNKGNKKTYDLIDGGIAANNPTLIAISHVSKRHEAEKLQHLQIKQSRSSGKEVDSDTKLELEMLVLSLGTGISRKGHMYNAKKAAGWGVTCWGFYFGNTPIIDAFMDASSDMVDIYIESFFHSLHRERNYLRIQEDTLEREAASMDKASKKNMQKLIHTAERRLKKQISRVNLDTGEFEEVPEYSKFVNEEGRFRNEDGKFTNEDALVRFAYKLSKERTNRLKK